MRLVFPIHVLSLTTLSVYGAIASKYKPNTQTPLLYHSPNDAPRNISTALFLELEELARLVDITYCVSATSPGILPPFHCLSRCADFPTFQLVRTWATGRRTPLSDSCGYIARDDSSRRLIVAFRGTYSFTNVLADLSTQPQEYETYPGNPTEGEEPPCQNCTVHTGFQYSWQRTREAIIEDLEAQIRKYPDYRLHLVGHSLGGAVAALGGLECLARGWDPVVTTFGEPRLGNKGLAAYVDERFNLTSHSHDRDGRDGGDEGASGDAQRQRFRRVTHRDDPVPLLPLTEWNYVPHAGEVFIDKPALSPDVSDVRLCAGDVDPACSASQDGSLLGDPHDLALAGGSLRPNGDGKDELLRSLKMMVHDIFHEAQWGIPTRYRFWNLLDAHRDYFWRVGMCVPGGDRTGGGEGKYEGLRLDGGAGG